MKFLTKSKDILLSIIFFIYFLPILFLALYASYQGNSDMSWLVLSGGLVISFLGSGILFSFFASRERTKDHPKTTQTEVDTSDQKIVDFPLQMPSEFIVNNCSTDERIRNLEKLLEEKQKELLRAEAEISQKDEEILSSKNEIQKSQKNTDTILHDFSHYKNTIQQQLEQSTQIIDTSQQTIAEQRRIIEKKQLHIDQLETKVRDLTYEIKTLLQLAEIVNQPSVDHMTSTEHLNSDGAAAQQLEFNLTPTNASKIENQNPENVSDQLKRCIDIAQKITGGAHYRTGSLRFRELAGDNYTLDLRRLFEGLRLENHGLVLFYSQKENKLLFASNQVKKFLGWNTDKFLQNFFQVIEPGVDAWKNGISQLAFKNQAHVDINMKNRTGQEIPMHGVLGMVPTGIFRNHIMAVLFPKNIDNIPNMAQKMDLG